MNNRNIVLYIASSVDGYIASEDESLDWLDKVEGEGDNGYSEFYETVDTILMGRKTYDWIINHNENFSYKNKECYVFSKSRKFESENIHFVNTDIINFINDLKQKEGKKIWMMGGGEILSIFLEAKLIDEIIITIAPNLIGKGIPLFKQMDIEIELELTKIKRYNQFAEIYYLVKK